MPGISAGQAQTLTLYEEKRSQGGSGTDPSGANTITRYYSIGGQRIAKYDSTVQDLYSNTVVYPLNELSYEKINKNYSAIEKNILA